MQNYNFGHSYQVKLAALCSRQKSFLLGYRSIIKPSWFDDDLLVDISRLQLAYFDKYKTAPSLDALGESVEEMLRGDKGRAGRAGEYRKMLQRLAEENLEDGPDVIDRVTRFARRQAVMEAVEKIADGVLTDEQYGGAEKCLAEALRVGTDHTQLGMDYFTDQYRFADDRTKHTITTGLPSLDKLLNGGSAPAELCIIEAPTGQFKTGGMVNIATAALWAGCDVCYASLEVRTPQVARRFDGPILARDTRGAVPEHVLKELQERRKQITGNFRIRYWPMGSAGISDIRAWLHVLVSEGIIAPSERPFLLVIDYGQILKPETRYSEKRHEVRDIYQSMIPLGEEFNCPVWTGMQTNRAAEAKALITKADLAECYAVAGDAHIILSLNQTKAERDENLMRIYIAKSRESRSFEDVEVYTDKELTRWKEATQNWVAPVDSSHNHTYHHANRHRGITGQQAAIAQAVQRRVFGRSGN